MDKKNLIGTCIFIVCIIIIIGAIVPIILKNDQNAICKNRAEK